MIERKPLVIGDLTAKVPVIQGGMGVGVSLSGLAGAVASQGGVGVISTAQIGWREKDFSNKPFEANYRAIETEIKKAREIAAGEGIIATNIMVATQRYEEYVKAAVNAGVDLIISGAGLPVGLPPLVEGTKTKIAPIVSSLKSLRVICKLWDRKYNRLPDMVVIEGPLAGGHLGFSKEELAHIDELNYDDVIRSIIEETAIYGQKAGRKIPVAVAGGIFTREDMDHALSLGADAVQVGTRFVTTRECDASQAYKDTYLKAKKEDIRIVQSPVGMPGRAIENTFMRQVQTEKKPIKKCYHCIITCKPAEIPYCITDALVQAVEGNVEDGLLFCGANAWKCRKMETVEEVMGDFR